MKLRAVFLSVISLWLVACGGDGEVSTAVPFATLDPAVIASPTPALVLTATLPITAAVLTPTLTTPPPTLTITAPTVTLPPPTLPPSPTPLSPPRTRSNVPAGAFPEDHVSFNLITDDNFLFHFQVHDTNLGNSDGAGIVSVKFQISDEDDRDDVIYEHTETNSAYCIFGGGEPTCNLWVFEDGRYRWGSDGPTLVSGDYSASIFVTPQVVDPDEDGETDENGNFVWRWSFDFRVDAPAPPPGSPPRTRSNVPAGAFPESHVAWNLITDDNYLFRFQVNDTNQGNSDGAGIVSVRFVISDQNGNVIYQRTENNAAYCIFEGGEPTCNPWVLENGRYHWGNDGPELVSGDYFASIYVTPLFIDPNENATSDPDGNLVWGWFFDFHIDVP